MVLVHEIGHALGLGHSSNENAIMYPRYHKENIPLDKDDVMGMKSLYGSRQNQLPPLLKNQLLKLI